MIATDLDMTLLRSDKTVSEYTLKTLEACKQHGIKVAFVTARSECECIQYINAINLDGIISNRGAIVRGDDIIIRRSIIDAKTSNKLLLMGLGQPHVKYIYVYTNSGYFSNLPACKHDPSWGTYNPDMYTDFSQGLDCGAYKITFEVSDDKAADAITAAFPELDAVRFTGEPYVSFANKSANKWEGVKALAAHFNVSTKDVAAFGDDYVDIEMLRECGVGVAVGNAICKAKAVADYICDTNDNDGVARWIHENLLFYWNEMV